MKQSKKTKIAVSVSAVLAVAGFVAGRYVGGATLLSLVHQPTDLVHFNTLSEYFSAYRDVREIRRLIGVGYVVNALCTVIPPLITMIAAFAKPKRKLHGDARFANDRDLKKSGLFPKGKTKYPDVLCGKMQGGRYDGQFIRFANQMFIAVCAPTRSGKGVAVVVPNCLNFRDSIVVLDIKLENFILTAGYRQRMGQEVFLFCPDGFNFNPDEKAIGKNLRSHRWNPLTYIRRNKIYRVGDCYTIANILYPKNGGKDDIWNELAQKVFVGLALYMLDLEAYESKVNLPRMLDLINQEKGFGEWCKSVIVNAQNISSECKAELNAFATAPTETQGSILSNFVAPLGILKDKITAEAVSGDDFDLRDLRKKRMSVYVGIQPRNLDKLSKLINLFFAQLIAENTDTLPQDDPSLKYQCLLILDEFTSMGRVNIILKSVAYTAGYNLRYLFIYQTRSQLADKNAYDEQGAITLLKNTAMKITFPPDEADDEAENISKTLGYQTVKHSTRSVTHAKDMSRGQNFTEEKRALMLPQEIVEFGFENHVILNGEHEGFETEFKENQLMLASGIRPFKAKKIVYFDEPVFIERSEYSKKNIPFIPVLDLKNE